jgi:2-deoxy-D-gluconate 3-dehydrogenase
VCSSDLEWAKHNILVNAIAPTFIETPMTKPMLEKKEFRDYVMGNIVLGRLAKVEDVTGAVIYLASEAPEYMTGCIVDANGASYLRT